MNETIITIFIIIFSGVFILIGSFALAYGVSYMECKAKAGVLDYKYDYAFFQGCVLEKPDGKKVLLEQLRSFE